MSKTPEGSPSRVDVKNNTPEGSPSIAGVENNSKKLSVVFEKMGQVAAKAVHVIREAYAAERIDVDAKRPENDEGVMERLGFPGNTENSTGASEGSTDTSKPGANKPDAKKSKADASQGKNAGEGTKSTSEKQDSNAKPDAKKSKADASQGKQAPDAAKDFMSGFLDRIKQDQGSSAAESSKDKQDKDSNPNTGEAQTKEPSPEKREAADELEKAKDRHSKASAAAKSKSPFGKKRRQAELKAATEQLKKSELLDKAADKLDESREIYAETSAAFETYLFKGKKRQAELEAAAEQLKQSGLKYMSLKFADKIEAAKQDPEKQAELAAEMAQAAFASMQETSRVTTDKYDSMLDDRNIVKKAAAKVGKLFNSGGRIAQWIKLGGTGLGVGTATGLYFGAAGWPITAVVGVVTKLGVVGITKQAVLEEHRGEDRIAADARLETTDPSFKNTVANVKIDDVMEHAVNVSVDNLKDVSIKRQNALYNKVKSSLGKYAAGFILGGFASSLADYLWDNPAHATGAESQKTPTPSQSGGNQIPHHPSGASSVDNSVDKIVNNINPDTSNFNSYDYLYSWAADKFGAENAMDKLYDLANKAMADGHTVQWFNNPDGSVWMKVDGSSVTADVLGVLNQYV